MSLRVFLRLFRHREMLAVGPLQPETIGLFCGGVLCIFFRKYMTCVRVGLGGQRYWCSVSSISPASFSSFKYVCRDVSCNGFCRVSWELFVCVCVRYSVVVRL